MTLATQVTPASLTEHVLDSVSTGTWEPRDIISSSSHASAADVMATLWQLVGEGVLTYDQHLGFPTFRPAGSAL